ncbi:MAG: UDP-2,3-diacylglucosamine diphosphatase [Gemmatimonadota bacterium]|nr:UDP-2,3-diacylglucosamine diphosphatase [Gemmatimonadota bacterium]
MLKTPCHVVSDLHLGVARAETERMFEAYLDSIRSEVNTLVINGDLFDFWFEWKTVIPRRGFRILAALARLRDSGTDVVYVAGNHDCWGGEVLTADVGVTYTTDAWEGTIGKWHARIEHGDGLREREDRKYRMVRPIMRSPLAIGMFRRLHPDWATRLASGSSSASRTYAARDGGAGLRAIALAELASHPSLDLIVYGHSHVAALERSPAGQVFANAGSWLDSPTYVQITDDSIELLTWTNSAERDGLDAIDRGA